MKFVIKTELDPIHNGKLITFHGSISQYEIETLNLSQFDRLLVKECSLSNDAADHLLILEMLFRKKKEQEKWVFDNEKINSR